MESGLSIFTATGSVASSVALYTCSAGSWASLLPFQTYCQLACREPMQQCGHLDSLRPEMQANALQQAGRTMPKAPLPSLCSRPSAWRETTTRSGRISHVELRVELIVLLDDAPLLVDVLEPLQMQL